MATDLNLLKPVSCSDGGPSSGSGSKPIEPKSKAYEPTLREQLELEQQQLLQLEELLKMQDDLQRQLDLKKRNSNPPKSSFVPSGGPNRPNLRLSGRMH